MAGFAKGLSVGVLVAAGAGVSVAGATVAAAPQAATSADKATKVTIKTREFNFVFIFSYG
jgi:hypothetical protein